MPPIIEVSDKDYEAIRQLGIRHSLVESPNVESVDFDVNPADYILLEGQSGSDGYPDLHVCKYRLNESSAVQSAGRQLGLKLQNTAREANGRGYIGIINREQALKLNLMLGGRTLNTRTTSDFLKLLFSGKAFDGHGKRVSEKELESIADEITGMRSPYRAEWHEDFFKERDGLMLNKNYSLKNGVLVPEYIAKLDACLMEDRFPGISLESWLENSTAQGYPDENVKSGDLLYWHPRADSVVRFYAFSGVLCFYGDRYPLNADATLGVRHVREAHDTQK